MLKEFDREQERHIDIVLDPFADSDAAFEQAVERCAAILDLARRNQYDARLITDTTPTPAPGSAAMRHLAGVRRKTGTGMVPPRTIQDLMRLTRPGAERIVISAEPSRATPIVLV